jgi:dienelactone hydrolase
MQASWARVAVLIAALAIVLPLSACEDNHASSGAEPTPAPEQQQPDPPWNAGDDDADDDFIDDDSGEIPPEPFDPMQPGPYVVGNRMMLFTDYERFDLASHQARQLLVEVWYPAEGWAEELPPDIIGNFLNGWDELILSIFDLLGVPPEELANFARETGSKRNAAIRADHAPYPVLLFSHGNAAVRFQNYTMAQYLASHGYVVIAPDHANNSVFVTYPDRLEVYNPLLTPLSFVDRQVDLSFLLDEFELLNRDDPDGLFTGMLDFDRVGAIGHSFGGNTVQEVILWDDRIRAATAFAGPQIPILPDGFDRPIMTMIGLEDHTMHDWEWLIRWNYSMRLAPKLMLEFIDGGHYTFTDACLLVPTLFGESDGCGGNTRYDTGEPFDYIDHDKAFSVINPYLTAFFGAYVKDQPSMISTLRTDLSPEEVIYNRQLATP